MEKKNPVVIGGVGGSGTRLIAQILIDLGYNFGNDLNESNDNLWFTLLFKRIEIIKSSAKEISQLLTILETAINGPNFLSKSQLNMINLLAKDHRIQHCKEELKSIAQSLIHQSNVSITNNKWGWKEPNSHIVLKQLKRHYPRLKYIQVIRNGLDMAYSENQNQLMLWGKHFLNKEIEDTPGLSLNYWCAVHKELIEYSQTMKADFYLLNFDAFCINPSKGLAMLCQFLEIDLDAEQTAHLLSLVNPPASIGRYKNFNLSVFDTDDIAYVKQLGFDTKK